MSVEIELDEINELVDGFKKRSEKAVTAKKHFILFEKECRKWIGKFGLTRYSLDFTHQPEGTAARSTCIVDMEAVEGMINLGTNWYDFPVTNFRIREVAFHEVCELLLWPLRESLRLAISEEMVNNKIHEVIHTLSNTFFK